MALSALFMAMLLLSMAFVTVVSAVPSTDGNAKQINTDDLKVGDIVAEGTRSTDGLCNFDDFKVSTTAPGDGKTNWVSIKFDKQCRAIIKAKWHGSLEEGPRDVIYPILNSMPAMAKQVTQEPTSLETNGAGLIATTGTKTSQQRVYTYGYGSPWFDVLTRQIGTITFSYNGSKATITSSSTDYYGADWTNSLGWKWIVDSKMESKNVGPANIVWMTSRGAYHCNPAGQFPCSISDPDGYYHSLYTDEDGQADGTSHCTFWKTGIVVFGPNRDILQGCS